MPSDCQRCAAELRASCRDGCTEAIMIAHGFSAAQMVDLVRGGLAAARSQRIVVGRRTVEIAYGKITEAGRRALADKSKL
jgi:hypothetical protein